MEDKPDYILKPGQPSLERIYREKTVRITIALPQSMHQYLMNRKERGVPAAEYIRRLIEQDMAQNSAVPDP